LEGGHSLVVLDVDVTRFVDTVEDQVVAVGGLAAVIRHVIDDDYLIIGVILYEDGVEVVLYAEIGVVIVSGDHDAHGQLLLDAIKPKSTIQSHPFLHIVLYGLLLGSLIKRHVVFSEVELLGVFPAIQEGDPFLMELLALLALFIVV
jgi:hypothetical protein